MIFMNVTTAWLAVHSDFTDNHQVKKLRSYSGSSVLRQCLSVWIYFNEPKSRLQIPSL